MVAITHNLVCPIATDPAATAAGKITPTTWNDTHAIATAAGDVILGNNTSSAGVCQELTLSQVLDLIGTPAQGDILFRSGATWKRLPIGANGYTILSQGAGNDLIWGQVSTLPFTDNTALIHNSTDATKLLVLSALSIASGTTRTLTAQNKNYTIADNADFANYTLTSGLAAVFTSLLASSADTLAGSSTIEGMSPGNFAANSNLAGTGHYTFPGGFKFNWGTGSAGPSSNAAVTFDSAFTTACYGLVGVLTLGGNNSSYSAIAGDSAPSTAGGHIYNTNTVATVTVTYIAWGK